MSQERDPDRPLPGPRDDADARTDTRTETHAAGAGGDDVPRAAQRPAGVPDDVPPPPVDPPPPADEDAPAGDKGGDEAGGEAGGQSEERRSEGDFGADEQNLVDRDKIDFDPDEGLYTGTAVEGNSDIPGPHQEGDDVEGTGPPEDEEELQKQRAQQDGDAGDEAGDTSG